MSIQQPRRLVTTDQGHADVINAPIDTLYENDLFLAQQIIDILTNPADHGVVSEEDFRAHLNNTIGHITAAERTAWNAAEANAKKYTDDNAAKKSHSHVASDMPSATTQARGIVQLSTSTVSTATDQAATPSAVKAAMDRANEAFQSASDGKTRIASAITGKGVAASGSDTFAQLAQKISQISTGKKFASGEGVSDQTGTIMVRGLEFQPSTMFYEYIRHSDYSGGFNSSPWFGVIKYTYNGVVYEIMNSVNRYLDGFSIQGTRLSNQAFRWFAIQ